MTGVLVVVMCVLFVAPSFFTETTWADRHRLASARLTLACIVGGLILAAVICAIN